MNRRAYLGALAGVSTLAGCGQFGQTTDDSTPETPMWEETDPVEEFGRIDPVWVKNLDEYDYTEDGEKIDDPILGEFVYGMSMFGDLVVVDETIVIDNGFVTLALDKYSGDIKWTDVSEEATQVTEFATQKKRRYAECYVVETIPGNDDCIVRVTGGDSPRIEVLTLNGRVIWEYSPSWGDRIHDVAQFDNKFYFAELPREKSEVGSTDGDSDYYLQELTVNDAKYSDTDDNVIETIDERLIHLPEEHPLPRLNRVGKGILSLDYFDASSVVYDVDTTEVVREIEEEEHVVQSFEGSEGFAVHRFSTNELVLFDRENNEVSVLEDMKWEKEGFTVNPILQVQITGDVVWIVRLGGVQLYDRESGDLVGEYMDLLNPDDWFYLRGDGKSIIFSNGGMVEVSGEYDEGFAVQLTRDFAPEYNGTEFIVGSSKSGIAMFLRK